MVSRYSFPQGLRTETILDGIIVGERYHVIPRGFYVALRVSVTKNGRPTCYFVLCCAALRVCFDVQLTIPFFMLLSLVRWLLTLLFCCIQTSSACAWFLAVDLDALTFRRSQVMNFLRDI